MFREKTSDGTTRITGTALAAWPVGAVYISVNSVSPADLFGGTWEMFSEGQMLLGVNPADARFNAPELAGGWDKIVLGHLPDHSHNLGGSTGTISANHTHTVPNHDHVVAFRGVNTGAASGSSSRVTDMYNARGNGANTNSATMGSNGGGDQTGSVSANHTHALPADTGGMNSVTNTYYRPPFVTVYVWKRVS